MKRLAPILLAALLALGFAALRPPPANADNGAIAINTKDGSSLFRLAFAIRRVAGDTVDETNAAVAFSSCSNCQTTAIAIEVVLITGDASTVTPTNLALAYNYDCSSCVSVADAYQFVFSTGGQVHFTADGNQMLAQIRRDLEALRHENLTLDELQAKLTDIVDRLRYVLSTQLVPAGKSGENGASSSGTSPPASTQPASTAPTTTESPPTTTGSTPATTEPATTDTTPTTTSATP
jgi:putative peptide zinc metalloprotease protein